MIVTFGTESAGWEICVYERKRGVGSPRKQRGESILGVDDEQPRYGRSPCKMRGVENRSPLMAGCHPTDLPEPGTVGVERELSSCYRRT